MTALNTHIPTMRLVRDDDTPVAPAGPSTEPVDVDALQKEVTELRSEVGTLRRRGETLNFHLGRIEEELRLAARLQQDFLPKTLPQIGRVFFHTLFRPAGHVSGDFYDVVRLDETHVGFYVADAVGHGVPAALLTMFIKHSLATKQIGLGGYRLLTAAETMDKLNKALIDQSLSAATFATAVYGTIDTTTGRVTFARAGHPHPMLLRADGSVETPACEGGLLGVFAGEIYEQAGFDMAPGDRLLLVTDGVEVCFPGDIAATNQRWFDELEKRRHLPARDLLRSLGELIDTEATDPLRDDVTMLVMEVR
jgi:sigma-B regulation protein RsbU (phosphoserine phosphatase)